MVTPRYSQCDSRATSEGRPQAALGRFYSSDADESSRHSKRLFYQIAIVSAVSYYQLRYVDVEEEETVDKAGPPSKMQPEDGDKAKDGAREDGKVDEDDVQVPETMPEDAFFVPLGFVRQRPHTHYKASDPEWQSFVEFGRDRERPTAVRSTFTSSRYRHLHLMLC